MTFLKPNFKYFQAFVVLILLSLNLSFSSFFSLTTRAEVFLKNSNKEDFYIFKLQPGEIATDKFFVTNPYNREITTKIESKDVQTKSGFLALNDNETKTVGQWLKPITKSLSLNKNQTTGLDFNLKVPENTKNQEYLGAIAVTSLPETETGVDSTAKIAIRKTMRTYILVGKDFNLNTEIGIPEIVRPVGDFFAFQKKYPTISRNNLIFQVPVQNTGNLYATINLKYRLKLPQVGEILKELEFVVEPGFNDKLIISTNQPYLAGKTELAVEYETKALNPEFREKIPLLYGQKTTSTIFNQEEINFMSPQNQLASFQNRRGSEIVEDEKVSKQNNSVGRFDLLSFRSLFLLGFFLTIPSLLILLFGCFYLFKNKYFSLK